jgi:hypothetical protein
MRPAPSRFIRLLNSGHLAPLGKLVEGSSSIDHFKSSLFKHRMSEWDPLRNQRYQDLVAQSLGFREWGEFVNGGWDRLRSYMSQHGLAHHLDLVDPKLHGGLSFSIRQVSDRLFHGSDRPEKVYTAVGVEQESPWFIGKRIVSPTTDFKSAAEMIRAALPGQDAAQCMEIVDGLPLHDLHAVANYLGSVLVQGNGKLKVVPRVYWPTTQGAADERAYYTLLGACVAEAIRGSDEGWQRVLRFNNNIAFLAGKDGSFDIVTRFSRDESSDLFGDNTLHAEIPPDYRPSAISRRLPFASWFDKQTDAWEENLRHEAETWYYHQGHSAKNYPGQDELLEAYLRGRGCYRPATASLHHGLDLVTLSLPGRRKIRVGRALVTVAEFKAFLGDCPSWRKVRSGQNLDEALSDRLDDQPAPMTYYDAIAYCRYLEDHTGSPIRLLQVREMRDIVQLSGATASSEITLDVGPRTCEWLLNANGARWRGPGRTDIGEMPPHLWGPRELTSSGGLGQFPELGEMMRVGMRVCVDAE